MSRMKPVAALLLATALSGCVTVQGFPYPESGDWQPATVRYQAPHEQASLKDFASGFDGFAY